MSTCATCRPINCDALVDDDLRLYSLQRTVFPFIISCPPGSICTNAQSVSILCCDTLLQVTFPAGSTASQRQALIQGMVNQCAFISAACIPNTGTVTPTVPPPGSPPPPPGSPPVQRNLFYNRETSRTSTCPDGTVFTFTVPAGSIIAQTQALADAQARTAAIAGITSQARFCPGGGGAAWFADVLLCKGNPSTAYASVTGRGEPFTWSVVSGSLPPGTYFNPNTGRTIQLRGTPTTVGTFNFTLAVRGGLGGYLQRAVSIEVTEVTVAMSKTDDSGGPDGTATATPTGIGPFTYLWSDGQTTQIATGLAGGTSPVGDYSVTVTDEETGCTVEGTIHIDVAGCVAVTDATVYSGGSNDPQCNPWFVVGGTATTVGFDVQLTGSITQVSVQNACGIPWYDGVFDFNPIASCLTILAFENTFLTTAPDVTGLTNLDWLIMTNNMIVSFPQQVNTSITYFTFVAFWPSFDPDAWVTTDIDCSGFTGLTGFDIIGHPLLTSFILPLGAPVNRYWISSCPLITTLDISGFPLITYFNGAGNSLDQATVDHVLTTLDANGLSGGTCSIGFGFNAPPSATGLTAKANLIGKGWTVTNN